MKNAYINHAATNGKQYLEQDVSYSVHRFQGRTVPAVQTDGADEPLESYDEEAFEPPEFEDDDEAFEPPEFEDDDEAFEPPEFEDNDELLDDEEAPTDSGEAKAVSQRLSLQEQLRRIADEPDDRTFLYGTGDQEMLRIMSIIAPLLEMRGGANGFAYVNPNLSLAKSLRGKTAADFDMEALDKVLQATRWLGDAWETQGSASAVEVMRNLVIRELLDDPELRFIIMSRIERAMRATLKIYEDAHIVLRARQNP